MGLGADGVSGEEFWVAFPHGDATMVLTAVLIVNNERNYLMPKTFLHLNQPAEATDAVFERVDSFKSNVQLQDILQLHFFLGLISLD